MSGFLPGHSLIAGCSRGAPDSSFVAIRAERGISGSSEYPLAVDPNKVGSFSPDTKSGTGYFYDEVLEYRVWLHPDNGAQPLNGDHDYFVAFAQYKPADAFSQTTPGAEPAIVLVRQLEWIDEPEHGHFLPGKSERVTEWQVRWLKGGKRTQASITEFMKHLCEAVP
jgi:hypothetical protein